LPSQIIEEWNMDDIMKNHYILKYGKEKSEEQIDEE